MNRFAFYVIVALAAILLFFALRAAFDGPDRNDAQGHGHSLVQARDTGWDIP